MEKIRKGNIYYADLSPTFGSEQNGERPVVILQNEFGNEYCPTIIVSPLKSVIKKTKLPTHIFIKKKDYLKYDSLVLLEQIRVIDKTRLISYVGKLSKKEISNINSAIVDIFDFDLIDYLKSYGIGGNYEKKKNLYSDYYSK